MIDTKMANIRCAVGLFDIWAVIRKRSLYDLIIQTQRSGLFKDSLFTQAPIIANWIRY